LAHACAVVDPTHPLPIRNRANWGQHATDAWNDLTVRIRTGLRLFGRRELLVDYAVVGIGAKLAETLEEPLAASH
jgi:hypothetical protein